MLTWRPSDTQRNTGHKPVLQIILGGSHTRLSGCETAVPVCCFPSSGTQHIPLAGEDSMWAVALKTWVRARLPGGHETSQGW